MKSIVRKITNNWLKMIRTLALLASAIAFVSAAKEYSVGSQKLVGTLQDAPVEGLCDPDVDSLSGTSKLTEAITLCWKRFINGVGFYCAVVG